MCDEADGRPSSTGSVELSRSHIEEIGYLSNNTIMYDKIQNGNLANGFPGSNGGEHTFFFLFTEEIKEFQNKQTKKTNLSSGSRFIFWL